MRIEAALLVLLLEGPKNPGVTHLIGITHQSYIIYNFNSRGTADKLETSKWYIFGVNDKIAFKIITYNYNVNWSCYCI